METFRYMVVLCKENYMDTVIVTMNIIALVLLFINRNDLKLNTAGWLICLLPMISTFIQSIRMYYDKWEIASDIMAHISLLLMVMLIQWCLEPLHAK
jgi:hypothetical protein